MGKIVLFLFLTTVTILSLQAQNQSWNRHVIDSSFSGADGVRLADVNNDKLMDIATGWEEGGYTKVYIHPGYNAVHKKWPSVIVGRTPSVEDAVFVDIDNNGIFDVVSSTEGRNNKVYINWAPTDPNDYLDSSKWRTEVIPASDGLMQWMFAIPAQVDKLNGIDIIIGSKNKNAKIGWFRAPESSRTISDWEWYPISSVSWVMSLLVSDMDQDGDLDIIISDRKSPEWSGIRWLENPGHVVNQKEVWRSHYMGGKGLEVMFMDMADMDGDGLIDAVVTEKTTQKIIFMRRLDGSGLKWKTYNIDIPDATGGAKAVKIGDINGDGRLDLVHATNTRGEKNKIGVIWMSFNNKVTDSNWEWKDISGIEGYKFDRIELLDLDGDGDLDVLTCEENYGANSRGLGVIWYENPINNETTNN